ncbi:MAG TPA: recombination-associated protein RdgC [Desulfomonilia bacterium]
MGILSNTVSISQYKVKGPVPSDIESWLADCLYRNRFSPIDNLPDEETTGWVSLFDYNDSSFSLGSPRIGDYIGLSLRRDKRSVPAAVIKSRLDLECGKWMADHPDIKKMPSKRKAEIRDNLVASLVTRSLPVPSVCDLIWNVKTSTVTFASVSAKTLELVEDKFMQTFEGLKLVSIYPMARAELVIDDGMKASLAHEDKASTKDVLQQINKNRWLGHEFLLWAMYSTSMSQGEYRICTDGPFNKGEVFVAYLHDSFLLAGEPEKGVRKSRIIGPQQDFGEAKKALAAGKNICEAAIYFEKADLSWSLNLKSDSFVFSSFKSPPVRIEKGELIEDPSAEREAAFLERMSLMDSGIQLFDSFFRAFLAERLSNTWQDRMKAIRKWMGE